MFPSSYRRETRRRKQRHEDSDNNSTGDFFDDNRIRSEDEATLELGFTRFEYDAPSHFLGAHASWDIGVRLKPDGSERKVFSGTEAVVYALDFESGTENVYLYNPCTGGILQYGHTIPVEGLQVGEVIHPGDLISTIAPASDHIHFSVIRPFSWDEDGWPSWVGDGFTVFDEPYYGDPVYFHEPATWGYWNEETIPAGLLEIMKRKFAADNSGVIPDPPGCIVWADRAINLRRGPGVHHEIVGSLQPGQAGTAFYRAADDAGFVWWQLEDGGWVRTDVVSETSSCERLREAE